MTACLALFAPVAARAGYMFTTFNAPGATGGTIVNGINDAGQVAGYFTQNGTRRGFVGLPGSPVTFDAPGATRGTFVVGLNASG